MKSNPHFNEQLRRMIAQKIRRKCAKCSHETTQQAVEIVLPDLFITGTAEIEEKMINGFYRYIEIILTTMVEKGTMKEVLDCCIECWTQSAFFMDAFTRRGLNSLCFTRLMETFVRSHMDKTTKEWIVPAKAEAVPPPKLINLWLQHPSSSTSSDVEARKKHRRARCRAQAP